MQKMFGLAAFSAALVLTGCGGSPGSTPTATAHASVSTPSAMASATNAASSTSAASSTASASSTPAPAPAGPTVPKGTTYKQIQATGGWQSCSAQRNGQTCAAGLGNAAFSLTQHQQKPSLSGDSALFWIGGSHAYSNALWWKTLSGDTQSSHFTYDLD